MAVLGVSSTSAPGQSVSETAREVDPLFQRMLALPLDLNTTLQYAVIATQAGDIESAISTYERLLFYNPALSRVRFELGVLYFRLGSYEMARGYFQTALQMQDISPSMRLRADEFIAAANKKLQPDQLSGFVQTGVRYQTNASAGPGSQTVLASGHGFDSRFLAQSDGNWFGTFGLNYVHDFGNQRGDTFEASILGYDAQQFKLHQFDIGLLEIRSGPRLALSPDFAGGVTFKPYIVTTGTLLADMTYSGGVGGGATIHANAASIALDPYVEVVQQSYLNSSFYPLASGLSGTLATAGLQTAAPVYPGLFWQSRLTFAHDDAQFVPYSYDSYSADVWFPWSFSIWGDGPTFTLTPAAGVTLWNYKAPDPAIDPVTTPHNLEWRVGLGLDIPVYGQVTLGLLTQYRNVSSNIPAFSTRDLSVTAGPTIRF
jgi:hypothetical protein